MTEALKKIYWEIRKSVDRVYNRILIFWNDLANKFRYGLNAPLFYERIWVDPNKITEMIPREEVKRLTGIHRNRASGVVIDWNRVQKSYPLSTEFRIQYCFEHWKNGKSWEELGVYDHMKQSKKYGSLPIEKIKERFQMLDQAFEETRKIGRLKTRNEMNPDNFREEDGILVHIGSDGKPFFGGNGFHRLAIAQILELPEVPACVGLVDKSSIKMLNQYRRL